MLCLDIKSINQNLTNSGGQNVTSLTKIHHPEFDFDLICNVMTENYPKEHSS
jgi:hypothetical protein